MSKILIDEEGYRPNVGIVVANREGQVLWAKRLRMGFIDDVEWILEQLPDERQLVLFSATMPSEIRRLSKKYLNSPAEITIKATELKERHTS